MVTPPLSQKVKKFMDVFFAFYVDVFCMYVCVASIYLHKVTHFHIDILSAMAILVANTLLVIGVYTFNKATDKKEDTLNERPLQYFSDIKIYVLSGSSFFVSFLLYLVPAKHEIVWCWFALSFLGIFYSFPRSFRLKNFFLIKNIVPAFCWFFSVSVLIYGSTTALSLAETMFLLTSLFLLALIFEIIWDLPDYEGDKASGVHTLPVSIGFLYTKVVLVTLVGSLFFGSYSLTNKLASLTLLLFIVWVSKDTKKYVYHVFLLLFVCIVTSYYFIDYYLSGGRAVF